MEKNMRFFPALVLFLFAGSLGAQQWELGAFGGLGFPQDVSVSGRSGAATAGFDSDAAWGVLAALDRTKYIGGEVRYTHRKQNLRVSSGPSSVSFSGDAHAIHYDFLV